MLEQEHVESEAAGGNLVVAVPIESGEGLEAARSAHFGHAAGFVLVEVASGAIVSARSIRNAPHAHGGCMSIVHLLAREGVTTVSAAGMGGGPLNGLLSTGIAVHHDAESATVREAVEAILGARTTPFGPHHACQGH